MATTACERRLDGDEPSGLGIGDRADFISSLPDDVLGTIVSLLPTRDGCRTQALSRRWRPIWHAAPLNLDVGDGKGFSEKLISRILSAHAGPARRILLTGICPLPVRHDRITRREIHDDAGDSRIDGWLRSRDLSSLQELELAYYSHAPCRTTLPPSVFRGLAPALRVARFGRCRLPPNLAVDLPHLRQLTLHRVTLTDETFCALLSGCPALESLLLEMNVGVRCLRVTSPTLRSIGFLSPWEKQVHDDIDDANELVVEDAPCLHRLLPLNPKHGSAIIRVVRAPKLEIVGSLSHGIAQLHLGTTVFQKMVADSLTTIMPTVKVLALDYVGPDLDAVLDFLKFFPCLESLYIVLDPRRFEDPYHANESPPLLKKMKNVRKYASLDDPTECLELHLKKVALKVYYGRGVEVDFARYFVLNAKVLERVEFGLVEDCGDKWRAKQNMQLQLEDKASRDARFEFKRFSWTTFRDYKKHTHDLSMLDPFGASFDGYVTL